MGCGGGRWASDLSCQARSSDAPTSAIACWLRQPIRVAEAVALTSPVGIGHYGVNLDSQKRGGARLTACSCCAQVVVSKEKNLMRSPMRP